jgi:hypothetical protein
MHEGRVFLLSPANTAGRRAKLLLRPNAGFELARRFQREGASIGELFAFVSGLYFRGKLAYATRFAVPPPGLAGSLVITADRGLTPPDSVLTAEDFGAMSGQPVDIANPIYREPLLKDAANLCIAGCEVVLLGSVATRKYLLPLREILGNKLLIPADFPGRGDMSRGALLLRAAREGVELPYIRASSLPQPGR